MNASLEPETASVLTPLIPSTLEEEIELALKTFEVPGCILAIVKDLPRTSSVGHEDVGDAQRFLRVFGTRDMAGLQSLTTHCRFPLGSNTKLIHLFALGHLLEAKGYTMETPIKEMMPDFEIYDKQVEGDWTCADIYSHMTGISGYELVFEKGMTMQQAIESLKVLKPKEPFRSHFQYSNLPFNIIDKLITHLSGKNFSTYVKDHALDRLGLTSTNYKEDDLVPKGWWKSYGADLAQGYEMKETGFVAGNCEAMRACGGLLMSGDDLLKWIEALPMHSIYHLASQPRVQLKHGFHSHSYPYEAATYGLATAQTSYKSTKSSSMLAITLDIGVSSWTCLSWASG
ncbi:hypothetical protein IAT40_007974 [Kwoniella sp. CBS 6097]